MINIINNLLKRNFFFISFLVLASLIIYLGEVIAEDKDNLQIIQKPFEQDILESILSKPDNLNNIDQSTKNNNDSIDKETHLSNTVEQNANYQVQGEASNYQKPKQNIVNLQIQSSIVSGSYKIEVIDGITTAFEVLEKASQRYGFAIEYIDYGGDLGKFITKISNIDTPSDYSYFWSLYYNGSPSQVGASNLILRIGDTVSWRYIKSDW
ncbi:MAG: DUF4430 domain-containing protein [bacterium]